MTGSRATTLLHTSYVLRRWAGRTAPKTFAHAQSQNTQLDYYSLLPFVVEDGLHGLEAQGLVDCFTMIKYLKNIHEVNPDNETGGSEVSTAALEPEVPLW